MTVAYFKTLQEKQAARYVADGAKQCPFCGSSRIEVRATFDEVDTMMRPMNCLSCFQQWDEVFELHHIEQVEQTCVFCGEIIKTGEPVSKVSGTGELAHSKCSRAETGKGRGKSDNGKTDDQEEKGEGHENQASAP